MTVLVVGVVDGFIVASHNKRAPLARMSVGEPVDRRTKCGQLVMSLVLKLAHAATVKTSR